MSDSFAVREFSFPFSPYAIQQEFMAGIFNTLEEKKLGIFESPTGTGKSLSLICGALTWLEEHTRLQKAELVKTAEEHIEDDDIEDWFNSATKRISKENEKREAKKELEKIERRGKRLRALHMKKNQIKSNLDKSGEDQKQLFLHSQDTEDSLKASASENDIHELDHEFILDDYVSDHDETADEPDAEEEDEGCLKIFYCSRTHSQLSQFVREIQKTRFKHSARVTSLSSRQNLCINDDVLRLPSLSMINERCLDLQNGDKCITSKGSDGQPTKKKKTSTSCPFKRQNGIQNLSDQVLLDVLDLAQLIKLGKQSKSCPYYASRRSISDAQLVVLPYNCVLHKATRDACRIKLKDNIVIVDEAHNLLETISNIYSCIVSYQQICGALCQISEYLRRYERRLSPRNLLYMRQIVFLVKAYERLLSKEALKESCSQGAPKSSSKLLKLDEFLSQTLTDNLNLFKLIQYIDKSKIAHKLHGFKKAFEGEVTLKQRESETKESLSSASFLAKLASQKNQKKEHNEKVDLDSKTNGAVPQGPKVSAEEICGSPLLGIVEFLRAIICGSSDGRIVVTVGKDSKSSYIKYLLLNPASQFHDVVRECRSVIVAGGTMSPLEEFKNQLFLSAGACPDRIISYSFDHVVPEENVLPIVLTSGPSAVAFDFTFKHRGDVRMIDELGRTLTNVCNLVPGGVVCFFPSYDFEESVIQRLTFTKVIDKISTRKKVFREPKKASQLEKVLNDYAKAVQKEDGSGVKGALLFCVVGGKMSEGINFSDDLGRGVIMVGMPYPNAASVELKEKMTYLDRHYPPGADGRSASGCYYEGLCFKAVNQSIGRSIRHRNDYACILLLDQRYASNSSKAKLPSWISDKTQVCTQFGQGFGLIRKFFAQRKVSS